MNKEEILNKYIDLIDQGYCSDCNELNCIDDFPHSKIARAIRELQQENQQLKDRINKAVEYIEKCNKEEGLSMYVDTWQHLLPLLDLLKGEINNEK